MKLYDCFKYLKNGGVIWVYSDPHFNDADCKLMNVNWPAPDTQVNMINSVVGKNDTIIFLGDIGDESYIKKIKGYKVLITGNHDKGASAYTKTYYATKDNGKEILFKSKNKFEVLDYISYRLEDGKPVDTNYKDDRLFDEVFDGPLFIGDKILLSHEPVDIRFGVNLHGHCHNAEQSICQSSEWAHVNVCSDVIGWKPVRLDKVVDNFKTISMHRLTIDNAIAKKCPVNDPNCAKRCENEK